MTQVSCGEDHLACVSDEGLVYTWGSEQNGRLGRDGEPAVPLPVLSGIGGPIRMVSCGGYEEEEELHYVFELYSV